jgi:hypothetical protein
VFYVALFCFDRLCFTINKLWVANYALPSSFALLRIALLGFVLLSFPLLSLALVLALVYFAWPRFSQLCFAELCVAPRVWGILQRMTGAPGPG